MNISKIGSMMILLGLSAIILDFVNFVPRILMWIYSWGNGVAWAIKLSLLIIGAILYRFGKKNIE